MVDTKSFFVFLLKLKKIDQITNISNMGDMEPDPQPQTNDIIQGTTCQNCSILQQEINTLKSELTAKESLLQETEAKLQKTEKQLKRSTDISDKLLLKIQKFTAVKQIKSTNGDAKNELIASTDASAVQNVWDSKPAEEFGVEKTSTETEAPGQPAAATSLADELKSAAQSVCDQQGYVYDQRTGMYYDYNSGYYYDNEKSLFFDPASGTYFYYDAESQEYKFHSQIDVSQLYRQNEQNNEKRSVSSHGYETRQSNKRPRRETSADDASSERRRQPSRKRSKKRRHRRDRAESDDESRRSKHKRRKHKRKAGSDDEKRRSKTKQKKHKKVKKKKEVEQSEPPPEGDLVIDEDSNPAENDEEPMETDQPKDREEGELSDQLSEVSDQSLQTPSSLSDVSSTSESESVSESESESEVPEKSKADEWEEYCTQSYAPCIRAMVQESSSLSVGSLHVITTSGGTMGRETGLGHLLVVEDPMISKMHCEFAYDSELKRYTVTDHASQNGTTVNGQRIGEAKVKSEPKVLHHLDELQLGGTRFSLHIHPGRETCDECEPGLVQARLAADNAPSNAEMVVTKGDREAARRKQLKNIRRKFGLEREPYLDESASLADGYTDKAAERRRTKGSDNPYQPDDPGASVHRAIPSENKGHKLLSKMGWSEGQGLGKSDSGITEPINVELRTSGAGLGCAAVSTSLDAGHRSRQQLDRRLKTQIRFSQLDKAKTTKPTEQKPMCFVGAADDDEETKS